MTASDNKSYVSYLNKLVDEYNNHHHYSIDKKPINSDYSDFIEQIETNLKSAKVKVGDRVRINKYNNIFSKSYTKNWSREIFVVDSVLKTNPWTCKVKDLNWKIVKLETYDLSYFLAKNYLGDGGSQICLFIN